MKAPSGRARSAVNAMTGLVAAVLVLGLAACSEGTTKMTNNGSQDAAGMTRSEVADLGPEKRFDLMGERYSQMQELLTEAQQQVSTDSWNWLTGGVAGPMPGPSAVDSLPGASEKDSYYLEMTRSINPAGAAGDRADAEPVAAFFESRGWTSEIVEVKDELDLGFHRFEAQATTPDGYYVRYEVQENGQYNMTVQSGVFWGDRAELTGNVSYRIPEDGFFPAEGASAPGVYIPFPKWTDPKLWGPDSDAK